MKDYNLASELKDLSIFECGKEECVREKSISLTRKKYNLFHYVIKGKGTLVLNSKEYSLSKDTIFFIPTDTDATYFADKDDPWTYAWIGIGGEACEYYLKQLDININNPIISDTDWVYRNFFKGVVIEYGDKGYLGPSAIGEMYKFFGALLENNNKNRIPRPYITVMLAKEFINNNYQFDITIDDIAKNVHVSPNYLSSLFQKEENMTTKRYLTKKRMESALLLLMEGRYKIKDVAEKVGYPSQLHFSNEFKKYYGKSPLFYKGEHYEK